MGPPLVLSLRESEKVCGSFNHPCGKIKGIPFWGFERKDNSPSLSLSLSFAPHKPKQGHQMLTLDEHVSRRKHQASLGRALAKSSGKATGRMHQSISQGQRGCFPTLSCWCAKRGIPNPQCMAGHQGKQRPSGSDGGWLNLEPNWALQSWGRRALENMHC